MRKKGRKDTFPSGTILSPERTVVFLTESRYVRGALVSGSDDKSKNRMPRDSIPVGPALTLFGSFLTVLN